MVAFSDPNDVMSYPVPETWVQSYVDSRLCPKVTNVTINIARVRTLFGLGTFADPLAAHTGYDRIDCSFAIVINPFQRTRFQKIVERVVS